MLHDLFKLFKQDDRKPVRKHSSDDLTGQTFGRILVLGKAGNDSAKNIIYHCRCSCGKETIVRAYALRRGSSKSCGCLRNELSAERMRSRH
jgi:hypothetical protein